MAPESETFDQFMARREAASTTFINGRAEALLALSTEEDPATFFPPTGDRITGAARVNAANQKGAAVFAEGSSGRFEILQSGSSDHLGFWTGIQHVDVRMAGKPDPVAMQLRTTEVFRRERGEWKLIHRHADMASK